MVAITQMPLRYCRKLVASHDLAAEVRVTRAVQKDYACHSLPVSLLSLSM
ncbi:hypothetical protein [Ruegeria marisrubri]|nr:hypothetical protein [Ruegeria marisrubri]